MTRNDARELFRAKGLTYAVLTTPNLQRLIGHIDAAMKASGLIGGTYRMRRAANVKMQVTRPWAALRCRAGHFDDREAVTFGPDGFIGFAGWADEKNIVPVLAGFEKWCAEMAADNQAVAA